VITLTAGEGGPEKGPFNFEHLGTLALVLVRLICDIHPGINSYNRNAGDRRHVQSLTMSPPAAMPMINY